jgi:hypothetical protein
MLAGAGRTCHARSRRAALMHWRLVALWTPRRAPSAASVRIADAERSSFADRCPNSTRFSIPPERQGNQRSVIGRHGQRNRAPHAVIEALTRATIFLEHGSRLVSFCADSGGGLSGASSPNYRECRNAIPLLLCSKALRTRGIPRSIIRLRGRSSPRGGGHRVVVVFGVADLACGQGISLPFPAPSPILAYPALSCGPAACSAGGDGGRRPPERPAANLARRGSVAEVRPRLGCPPGS